MPDIILKSNNIVKSYKNSENVSLQVLRGINLEIVENKISVIIGASGAGKSTLLHLLSGLDRPDSGEVIFDNRNIYSLNDNKLAQFRNNTLGFVFQFHHLLNEFTAAENVAIPLLIKGVSLKSAMKRAEELLDSVGLKDRLTHKPAELSGGEQQRISVARALANNPSIIFADEPTGNLDSANGKIINDIFLELRDKYNKTFIIVTHNAELVKLADYVYEIKDGIIIDNNEPII
ncbi:MAG TPA: ABC transporter ATP-binding protein [Ignavibacteriaceae bacterium]|nr:ABC transporter ATP-binding protein [Ignavibacteriaceae bacterium]